MKTYKILFCLLFISFSILTVKANITEIQMVARIKPHEEIIEIIRESDGNSIPSLLQNNDLKKIISSMKIGDEAIVKGHISYQPSIVESQTQYKPVFLITSIAHISLKTLGLIDSIDQERSQNFSSLNQIPYKQASFPITTEVASALTMTTTALLMTSLTANPNQGTIVHDINSGMILFAGVLATGVFIFEQIHGKKIR